MALPPKTHTIWSQLIAGQKHVEFECLAVKMFLGRVRMELAMDPGASGRLASQLYECIKSNETLPSLQRDLSKLSL